MLTQILPWPYRLLASLALIAVLTGAANLQGRRHEQDSQLRDQVDSVLRVVRIERAQQAISNQVATAHEQGRVADRMIYKTIEREVVRYVAKPDHAACQLNRGWVQLHDAAALSRIPPTPPAALMLPPAALQPMTRSVPLSTTTVPAGTTPGG